MDRLLLTVEESAEVLGISRWRVYTLLREGQLASVKLGRARRVPRAVLTQFVEECVVESDGYR